MRTIQLSFFVNSKRLNAKGQKIKRGKMPSKMLCRLRIERQKLRPQTLC